MYKTMQAPRCACPWPAHGLPLALVEGGCNARRLYPARERQHGVATGLDGHTPAGRFRISPAGGSTAREKCLGLLAGTPEPNDGN